MHEAIDLYFTATGDLDLSPDGDLRDTRDDSYRSLRQEVATIAQANYNDWALHPDLGANLAELMGYPNNETTAGLVQAQLEQALSSHLLRQGDFRVDVFPLGHHVLGAMISIQVGEEQGEVQTVTIPVVFHLGRGVFAV